MVQVLDGKSLVHNVDGKNSVLLTKASGPQELGAGLEAELIQAGIAKAIRAVATDDGGEKKSPANTPPDKDDAGNDKDDKPYSIDMKAEVLRELLKANGLPAKIGTSKADMVAALDDHFASLDADEELPDLGAEGPVV